MFQLTAGQKRVVLIAVALLLAVSGGLLWDLGYNYDGLFGNPATKIHPSTYLFFGVFAYAAVKSGAPVAFLEDRLARRPAACWLMTLSLILLIATILRSGPGLAGLIDTYACPAVLALLIVDYSEADIEPLTLTLHIVMTINAVMGLVEFASSTLFFPFRLDGVAFVEDTRSSALQGHALTNAALTGVYVISLMAGARTMQPWLKLGLILLQFAALAVFGGRTAIVVSLALTPFYGVYFLYASLRRGRVSLLAASAVLAAAPLLALAIFGVIQAGFADKLLARFADDNGSAATRVIMFEMLKPFSWFELAVGPDVDYVEYLRRHFGLEQGVENPFVRITLYQGGLVMASIFLSLVWFFREQLKGRGFAVLGPVLAMAVLLNSSESIATKTNFLAKLVVIFVCLFPRRPQRSLSPSASTMAGSSVRSRSSISPIRSNRHQNAHGNPNPSALSRTSRI